jgi:hypothetical protein
VLERLPALGPPTALTTALSPLSLLLLLSFLLVLALQIVRCFWKLRSYRAQARKRLRLGRGRWLAEFLLLLLLPLPLPCAKLGFAFCQGRRADVVQVKVALVEGRLRRGSWWWWW